MVNFNFRLERVLNYKKTVEDYKKSQYGMVQQRLHNEENKLDEFNQYKNNIKDEKNVTAVKTKVGNLAMYNNYINDLSKMIRAQEKVVTKTRDDANEAKEELIAAAKEKKIFEKLKEHEYEEHLYQLKRDEEKQTDTITSYRSSTQQQ
ncbi:flagellar export protein FliJ [Clostridium sp. Cult3]|uniref:flagellar export protein FliJ n=1 Tax=Clostridium sp. Cult3 TaxID=2079004 RepID=UPI001EFF6220|nr:flagellar export protein FliJ [Clostridium sp. Cult3]MCF6460546.1 flagellar export protein FliJ [Clostridium sp. Cult3]